ncbi:MAG: ATP synthase F0 subunit B [Nitrospirae bacterium]|nr:ATP synthase F0 subunit B [Nitrospirota bacterium]
MSGEHGVSLLDWVWKILNFGILVFILVKFLNKPLRNYFKERKELIEKAIKESQEAKEIAIKALADVQEKVKLKDTEIEAILAASKRAGEHEKQRLIEEGEHMKAKIIEQARSNIDYEVRLAKESIKAEAVEAALRLAEEKIRSSLSKDVQDKLLEESISLMRKN